MNGNNIFYFETDQHPKNDSGNSIHRGQFIALGHRLFQVLEIAHPAVQNGVYRVRIMELTLILEQAAPPTESSG